MILLKNCHIHAPEDLGKGDLLLAGGQICALSQEIEAPRGLDVQVIDACGAMAVPGLVDGHVHIDGGGGEGGPQSRTRALEAEQLIRAGVTSVVGCLGFDGITRSLVSLLMKAKQLRAEGFGAWIYTGSYQMPTPTITGDVSRDIALFEEIIGVGEVAIADRRSSFPTALDLVRLAKSSRTGGMLGGCCGLVHLHLGDEPEPFSLIEEAVALGRLCYHHFYPTHCTRNAHIFEASKVYGKLGPIDITASSYAYFPKEEVKPAFAVRAFLEAGVPLAHLTMSSDACGSLPRFDAQGDLIGHDIGQPDCLLREVWDMVDHEGLSFSTALATVTSNPARILKLEGRGRLALGGCADVVLLNRRREVVALISNGVIRHLDLEGLQV